MQRGDTKLLIVVSALLILGLVILTSASAPSAYKQFGTSFFFLKRQLLHGLLPGIFGFLIFAKIDYRRLRKAAPFFYFLALALLFSVFIPGIGQSYGKTLSWMRLGSFYFQPAEAAKLFFIIALAAFLARAAAYKPPAIIPFLVLSGGVLLPLFFQPDVGTMSVVIAFAFMMFFAARASVLSLAGIAAFHAGFIFWLIKSVPYRASRLMTFLYPELDPRGIGYHVNQALLAVGSGGLLGLGLGHSRQKFQYLPEVQGDSIFAIMAEELGFLISLIVIAVFLVLIFRGIKIAEEAPDDFGKYLAVGIVSWIGSQAFLNIGSMIGLLPLTGLPLPFISYGGSALAALLGGVGILWNISAQQAARRKL